MRAAVLTYHSSMSRIPRGRLRPTPGTSAMSPKVRPPKLQKSARSVAADRRSASAREVPQFVAADERELLGVVGRIQPRLVYRLLADDRVEEVAAGRHQPARRHASVVLGPLYQLAVRLVGRVEVHRHQHWRAVGQSPCLERHLREPEHRARAVEADGVHAQRGRKVGRDLAEHLVDLDDLDRRAWRIEPQRLPELIDHADVDAGLEAAAEVDRQAIGLGVGARRRDAFARRHRGFPEGAGHIRTSITPWRATLAV